MQNKIHLKLYILITNDLRQEQITEEKHRLKAILR
jgi:hypothetical protein